MLKSKISRKLSMYFGLAFVIFAIVIGSLFFIQFRNYTIELHKTDLKNYAQTLAEALSGERTHDLGSGQERYGAYMRFIGEVAGTDVWIVDENMNLLTVTKGQGAMKAQYNYADLPPNANLLIDEVFDGETAFSEDFSGVLTELTLTVGAPIRNAEGQIWGAVLLHSPVEGTTAVVNQGLIIIISSILISLLVAFLLSILLSDAFTRPLSRMKTAALRLVNGDYKARCDIRQNDEIGELSLVLDSLAVRLDDADQESSKLEKMRRDFVANISHELKTPVTVIRGSLEALCDEVVTKPEQVASYHQQMLSETKFLQRLVEDLLDLSRLQNTDFAIDSESVNLCDILSDAVKSASSLARDKRIDIQLDMPEPCLFFWGDYGRLRQMLLIVLDNAIKFSPEDSVVTLIVRDHQIIIRDQGSGFDDDVLPFIFDRFYKSRDEQNKSGTGLGLSIAKQIADRHHILLSAGNRQESGAEFIFTIPTMESENSH